MSKTENKKGFTVTKKGGDFKKNKWKEGDKVLLNPKVAEILIKKGYVTDGSKPSKPVKEEVNFEFTDEATVTVRFKKKCEAFKKDDSTDINGAEAKKLVLGGFAEVVEFIEP